ncbi:formylglycine-generating enzyme family protein, partial [Mycobacterium tuberculosis]
VRAFAVERHPVTNAQFAEFVSATGYVTTSAYADHAVPRHSRPLSHAKKQAQDRIPHLRTVGLTRRR